MLAGFVPILVLAAIVYGVVRLVSRRGVDADGVSPEGDIREVVGRIFRLGLLAAATALLAEGLAALIAEALPRGDNELARDSLRIAQAFSFTIVGIPAVAGLTWWTRKELADDEKKEEEAKSVVWAGFLAGSLLVALIVAILNINIVLGWAINDEAFQPRALGRTIVWSSVVGLFWWLNRQRPSAHVAGHTPVYILAGSAIGLAVGGFRLWELGRTILRAVIDPLWDDVIVGRGDNTGRDIAYAASLAVVGVGVWLWFWWFDGRRSPRTERWYTYVLLVGVLTGVVTAIWASGLLVNVTLQWYFGDPDNNTAAAHFESMPGALSALAVGGAIWLHHQGLLSARKPSPSSKRIEPDRIYDYLGSAAGLVLIGSAATIVVAALVEAIAGGDLAQASVANTLINAFTFAVIGVPLMAVFWVRAQRMAGPAVDGFIDEVRAPTRRVYLISMLGISAAIALIALVISLTIFFEDTAAGELSSDTLYRLRFGLGPIITAAAIAAYHFLIYRGDRVAMEVDDEQRRASLPPPELSSPEAAAFVTSDLGQAQARLEDSAGPNAVIVTRDDEVDVVAVLEATLSDLRGSGGSSHR